MTSATFLLLLPFVLILMPWIVFKAINSVL